MRLIAKGAPSLFIFWLAFSTCVTTAVGKSADFGMEMWPVLSYLYG